MKKVVVIGDGIVGLLSALTSAKYNHDVTLINIGKQANKDSKIERYFSINLLSLSYKCFFLTLLLLQLIFVPFSIPNSFDFDYNYYIFNYN